MESEFYHGMIELCIHELVWIKSTNDDVQTRLENFLAFGPNDANVPASKWLDSCEYVKWRCHRCMTVLTFFPKIRCFGCAGMFRAEMDTI